MPYCSAWRCLLAVKRKLSHAQSKTRNPVIAVTMGDPEGIGPEVVKKALARPQIYRPCSFIVLGHRASLKGLPAQIQVEDISYRSPGEGAVKFLDRAISLIKEGLADALVTAPLSKESVSRWRRGFVGHTEYLAQAFGVQIFDMMFIAPGLRLTTLTRHVPLKDVPALITAENVCKSVELMARTLKAKFKIKSPRIAVLGLNPHAGEGGLLGSEDRDAITPGIRRACSHGIRADGPFPADTFFAYPKAYDGVIAMYHDQGLAPIKGMYMKELVNFTAGLPFVRTSPAHGTAYDIAGKNKADPASMIAAVKLACELA